jgi:hypothetical protein
MVLYLFAAPKLVIRSCGVEKRVDLFSLTSFENKRSYVLKGFVVTIVHGGIFHEESHLSCSDVTKHQPGYQVSSQIFIFELWEYQIFIFHFQTHHCFFLVSSTCLNVLVHHYVQ